MPTTKQTDIRVTAAEVFFLPVAMRVPLKFGPETVTNVVCLRVRVTVADKHGKTAQGWGETPLSVSWVWPSTLSVAVRAQRMQDFSTLLAKRLVESGLSGHPMEIGQDFMHDPLAATLKEANAQAGGDAMPYLGSLVAFSAFDIAVQRPPPLTELTKHLPRVVALVFLRGTSSSITSRHVTFCIYLAAPQFRLRLRWRLCRAR